MIHVSLEVAFEVFITVFNTFSMHDTIQKQKCIGFNWTPLLDTSDNIFCRVNVMKTEE